MQFCRLASLRIGAEVEGALDPIEAALEATSVLDPMRRVPKVAGDVVGAVEPPTQPRHQLKGSGHHRAWHGANSVGLTATPMKSSNNTEMEKGVWNLNNQVIFHLFYFVLICFCLINFPNKRHKKNLQVYEELQKLNKILVEGPKELEPNNGTDGTVQEPNPEKAPDEAGTAEPRVCGTKRKMKMGRGGKRMRRTDEGPRPEAVPLICELCNVKCDSKVVFDTHLMGKKHVLNMKKFQGHQNMLGQAALQALYPALEALYPALQALCHPNAAAAAANASSSAFSLHVHGPQEYGAPAGSVASLESAPLAVLESVGEDSKTEGGGTQKDVIEEGENQQQQTKENLESEQIASVDTNDENGNAELGKKDVVDLQVDDSVVAPRSANPGTEA